MSKHFLLNSICVTLFGTFIGYSVTYLVIEMNHNLHNQGMQEMASIKEESHLNEHTISKLASHQVYQDYFDLRVKHEVISKTQNGRSLVKAIISAKKDLPAGLNYKWKLGQDVTASLSDLSGQLPEIKRGEKREIFLTVYGFHKHTKSYLSIIINGNVDHQALYKETLSSSRPEDSFEYIVQQNFAQEQKQQNAQKQNGKLNTQSVRSKKFNLENIIK